MKTLFRILTLAVVLMAVQSVAFSQANQPTFTTLASAVADNRVTTIRVTSATGFTASNQFTGQEYGVFIDNEFMYIRAVSGTTITVIRGYTNTGATPHKSGALAIVGLIASQQNTAYAGGVFIQTPMRGSCVASQFPFLPLIQVNPNEPAAGQVMYNCNNGSWQVQTLPDTADAPIVATRACTPPGLQALGLLTSFGDGSAPFVVGNNTTPVAGTVLYGTIYLPQTQVLTGISFLNGTVAGTDNVDGILYRADGQFLTKTLAGGTAASGVGRFQDINFTATYLATGPARYWVAWQGNGTTTRIRTINLTPGATTAGLGAFTGVLGSSVTGTFDVLPSSLALAGTPANSSLPTTLINATAPIACLF